MRRNYFFACAIAISAMLFFGCEKDQIVLQEQDTATPELKGVKTELNSYIVVFKSDATFDVAGESYYAKKEKVFKHADKLLKKNKIKSKQFKHLYGKAVKGFAMELTEMEAVILQNEESVLRVEIDKIIALAPPSGKGKPGGGEDPTQITPWGITRVGGPVSGAGKTAWIIDSGIDLDHPDLNVDTQRAAVFLGPKDTPDDQNGHGTHVAGTVAALDNNIGVVGVAPGASVVPVRVLDRRGSGSTSGVIAGVDYVAANASSNDVANMSLGGGISTTLDEAVLNASSQLRFVLAAGNESDDANSHSPARVNGPNVYTISAMDINDNWAYFSNYGPSVDYCAPGYSIESTYKNGGYSTLSGTSMAAPHVCGLLLLTNNLSTDGYVNNDPDGDPDPIAHL
ncbi:S8 family peptidase [Carboxylicivirga sediminis]|uniref:S8 family peptidase n=1 Tax=Carboxylicivirga sediminis TaxID=2006564 RepID=A0A941F0C3_9BACT|nr:S8 family peptidase [Carboxylicivirga sediminis]MBR8534187.1 S8 family peptidase [Carboxylicivirga sediminis]